MLCLSRSWFIIDRKLVVYWLEKLIYVKININELDSKKIRPFLRIEMLLTNNSSALHENAVTGVSQLITICL